MISLKNLCYHLTACTLALSGCTHVKEANTTFVSATIGERLDKEVQWQRNISPCDHTINEAIQCLLHDPLSADAAVQIALLNNPEIQAAFEDIGIAQADFIEAGLFNNPVYEAFFRIPDRSFLCLNTEFAIAQSVLDPFLVPLRKKIAAAELEDTLPSLPMDEFSDECLEELALSKRLDLEAAKWEIERIVRMNAVKQWWAYTQLSAGYAGEKDPGGAWTQGPAFTGAIPIFNYGQAERARLYAAYRQKIDRFDALKIALLSEVRSARDQLMIQRSIVLAYQKVREGITDYHDPGWYQNPPGTVATQVEFSEGRHAIINTNSQR